MESNWKRWTNYLVELGIEQVPHTGKSYLAHLVGVYQLMAAHGQDEELCRAGLFHSIYGTEKFQGFKLPLSAREELAALIGARAEQLAYWNCLMDRASLDELLSQAEEPFLLRLRETNEAIPLSRAQLDDLSSVHLFDWLEQAPRSRFGWDYRRAAYRQMAERLGPAAVTAYDRTFAQEPAAHTNH